MFKKYWIVCSNNQKFSQVYMNHTDATEGLVDFASNYPNETFTLYESRETAILHSRPQLIREWAEE